MKDEALRQALDYIIATNKSSTFWLVPQSKLNKTVTAIKQALEQSVATNDTSQDRVDETAKQRHEPEPEWYYGIDAHDCLHFYHKTEVRPSEFNTPLYTSPPKREPLTDDELIQKMLDAGFERNSLGWTFTYGRLDYHLLKFARAIEAAHGIKE